MRSRIHRFLFGLGASGLMLFGASTLRADEFDLVTAGSNATINGAIYQQGDIQPAGTGVFGTFLRMQSHGSKNTVESGFNTDFRPAPLDDKNDAPHNHSLLLSNVGIVNINGTDYRQFALDINEPQSMTLLSLDKLQLFLASTGNIADLATLQSQGTKVFDQGNNFVVLNASLSHGSGQSDLFVDIPNSVFTGPNQFVYLYSEFGDHNAAGGGFEEWAALQAVPEPSEVVLIGMGISGCFAPWLIRRTRTALSMQIA